MLWPPRSLRLPNHSAHIAAVLGCILLTPLFGGGCVRIVSETDIVRPPHVDARFQDQTPWTGVTHKPDAALRRTPETIIATDGTPLRGYFITCSDASANVIFLHGSQGAMYPSRRFLTRIAELFHVNVLAIDYRGYGFSDGRASLESMRGDARNIYDWLAAEPRNAGRPIVVFGYSLGTALALDLGANRPLAGVILIAPFTSAAEFCDRAAPRWALGLLRFRADDSLTRINPQPIECAARIACPLLVLHPEHDEIVPIDLGEKIFDAAESQRKSFVVMPDASHLRFHIDRPPAREALREFFATISEDAD